MHKRILVAIAVSGLLLLFNQGTGWGIDNPTAVTQTITPGVLSLVTQPAASMSAATLSGSSQSTTGSLGLSTVTDARGSGAGWSLTATTTAFSRIGVPVRVSGTAGSLTTGGTYTGTGSGVYTVTIITGGVLGVATYSVSGLETQAATLAGSVVGLGSRGLNLTFAGATYTPGEQWTIAVDTIPASNLTITPSAASTISGSSSGVTAGSAYTFATGNDPATIMTASSGSGLGVYTDTPALTLAIPANTKAGVYAATITQTLN